jgi:hypothetical protein
MGHRGRQAVQERLNWEIDGRRFVDVAEAAVRRSDTRIASVQM